MKLEGRAVVIARDNVDTDVLYPGPYLNVTDVETMKLYLFEGLDPSLRDQLGGDTALVVGENFGPGSSREHVPQAMKAWGIQFLVGRSFARIFSRNCLNLGLPIVTCPEAVAASTPGSILRFDLVALDRDDRLQHAGDRRLDLLGHLLRFDFEDHLAGGDRLALALVPACDGAELLLLRDRHEPELDRHARDAIPPG